jgi:hypothetical protein
MVRTTRPDNEKNSEGTNLIFLGFYGRKKRFKSLPYGLESFWRFCFFFICPTSCIFVAFQSLIEYESESFSKSLGDSEKS